MSTDYWKIICYFLFTIKITESFYKSVPKCYIVYVGIRHKLKGRRVHTFAELPPFDRIFNLWDSRLLVVMVGSLFLF